MLGPRLAAACHADLHQRADAVVVDRLERIVRHDVVLAVVVDEAAVVVAAHAERGLRQVVGAEAEELGLLGDLIGAAPRPAATSIIVPTRYSTFTPFSAKTLLGRLADDLFLVA